MPERILVVDDEENMTYFLSQLLGQQGYQVEVATDGQAAIDRLQGSIYDLVISDIRLPGLDDMAVLKAIRESDPLANVILITAYASVESAVQALREGAYDYLIKPFRAEDVLRSVERALERRRLHTELGHLRQEVQRRYAFHNLVGKSRAMQEVYDLIRRVAPARSAVLIRGESGTGKELVARAIHYNSPRKHRRFVAINCGAIPEPLLESELFGHVRGAFTGAAHFKRGLFEEADGGTIFLDETDTLSPAMQVKLLRVLQDHQIRRLGETAEVPVELRLVAATNRDLGEMVQRSQFRDDLFYRLNVITISLPPLRERREDIPLLAQHFLKKYAAQEGKPLAAISREAMVRLLNYPWPGNVRELENAIERAVALGAGEVVLPEDLPPSVRGEEPSLLQQALAGPMTLAALEQAYLSEVLHRMGGHQSRAAQALGIDRRTLYRKIRKYGLDRGQPAPPR